MNNFLKCLLKKERKDSPIVPSSTGDISGGSVDKQDAKQMTTYFQGSHHFIAQGPFTSIQGDQVHCVLSRSEFVQ